MQTRRLRCVFPRSADAIASLPQTLAHVRALIDAVDSEAAGCVRILRSALD